MNENIIELLYKDKEAGKVTLLTIEGPVTYNLESLCKQFSEGLLYDLNRDEAVTITLLRDGKDLPNSRLINDFAVAQVIKYLKSRIDELEAQVNNATQSHRKLTIYTDGACKGNPGPGGWAFQIYDSYSKSKEPHTTKYGGKAGTTNNEMELTAIWNALQYIDMYHLPIEGAEVEVISDSQYAIKCITEWGPRWIKQGITDKANSDLIFECINLLNNIKSVDISVKFTHVNGHVGIAGNESVDKLASDAALKYK